MSDIMKRKRSPAKRSQNTVPAIAENTTGLDNHQGREQAQPPEQYKLDNVQEPLDSVESVLLLIQRVARDPSGDFRTVTPRDQWTLWKVLLCREEQSGNPKAKDEAAKRNKMVSVMQSRAERDRRAEEQVRARAREQVAERANVVNTSKVMSKTELADAHFFIYF